jgi:hypothetical protein
MAAFKLNPPDIRKTKLVGYANRDGTVTGYYHATLGEVAAAIVDSLAQHGFSHSWETKQVDGLITVNCKITHRMGHSESTSMQAAPDQSGKKNAIQAVASSITYMQRYTLLAATGLATTDMQDDDGQSSGEVLPDPDRPFQNESRQPQGDPRQAPTTLITYTDEEFEKVFPDWAKVIQSGRKTAEDMLTFVANKAALTPSQIQRVKNCK